MGHVDRFEIIFDNEQGVFHEGDRVSGHVEIVNWESVKYKGEAHRQIIYFCSFQTLFFYCATR